MTRLTLNMFLTLDGVYQAPGEPNEDRSGGFQHGGWLVPYTDEDMMRFVSDSFEEADGFLFGRRTYEIFANYWPHVTDRDNLVASKLNELPKYVASRSLSEATWTNSTIIDDVVSEVTKLKSQPGRELQVHGCGNLAQTLMRHGLIDEYRLFVHPVILGSGKRLFAEGALPSTLELVKSTTSGTGVVVSVLRPVGKPAYGDFGIEELNRRGVEDHSKWLLEAAADARRGKA